MREILFRGKRVDGGEWVTGGYWVDWAYGGTASHYIPQWNSFGLGYHDHVKVDPKTVGQYTGLKDKNGVRIFEGDIVKAWSEGAKAVGVIKQRIDGMWLIYPAWQDGQFWGLCPTMDGKTTVEVIGDIHDNPELLEVE